MVAVKLCGLDAIIFVRRNPKYSYSSLSLVGSLDRFSKNLLSVVIHLDLYLIFKVYC